MAIRTAGRAEKGQTGHAEAGSTTSCAQSRHDRTTARVVTAPGWWFSRAHSLAMARAARAENKQKRAGTADHYSLGPRCTLYALTSEPQPDRRLGALKARLSSRLPSPQESFFSLTPPYQDQQIIGLCMLCTLQLVRVSILEWQHKAAAEMHATSRERQLFRNRVSCWQQRISRAGKPNVQQGAAGDWATAEAPTEFQRCVSPLLDWVQLG